MTEADEYAAYCKDMEIMVGEAIRVNVQEGRPWREVARLALRAAVDCGGWPGLRAMDAARDGGQQVLEDAGGYRMRTVGYVFGVTPDRVGETYSDAVARLTSEASAKQP